MEDDTIQDPFWENLMKKFEKNYKRTRKVSEFKKEFRYIENLGPVEIDLESFSFRHTSS